MTPAASGGGFLTSAAGARSSASNRTVISERSRSSAVRRSFRIAVCRAMSSGLVMISSPLVVESLCHPQPSLVGERCVDCRRSRLGRQRASPQDDIGRTFGSSGVVIDGHPHRRKVQVIGKFNPVH